MRSIRKQRHRTKKPNQKHRKPSTGQRGTTDEHRETTTKHRKTTTGHRKQLETERKKTKKLEREKRTLENDKRTLQEVAEDKATRINETTTWSRNLHPEQTTNTTIIIMAGTNDIKNGKTAKECNKQVREIENNPKRTKHRTSRS